MTGHNCKTCGAALERIDDFTWSCSYCGNNYKNEQAEFETNKLLELLDDYKREQINNLRKNLYDALKEKYTDSFEICRICSEIKKYLPDDFAANFFYTANHATYQEVSEAIRNIEIEGNECYIHDILHHMIKSLRSQYVLPLQNLIERAYKNSNLKKYEDFSTLLSDEAGKVLAGCFDTFIPRDVFVAYSSNDMKEVERLVEYLESNGFDCFVAARNLRHGRGAVQNYEAAINEAIENCKCVVFVSSVNSRTVECDALRLELKAIKQEDIVKAPAEYRYDYANMPSAYKKPRIEYRIDNGESQLRADKFLKEFFAGLEYAYSPEEVLCRLDELDENQIQNAKKESEKTKFCSSCGSETAENIKFCPECGSSSFVASREEFLKIKADEKVRENKQAEIQRKKEEKALQKEKEKANRIEATALKKRLAEAGRTNKENAKNTNKTADKSGSKEVTKKVLNKLRVIIGHPLIPTLITLHLFISLFFQGNVFVDLWRILLMRVFSAGPSGYIVWASFLTAGFATLAFFRWVTIDLLNIKSASQWEIKRIAKNANITYWITVFAFLMAFSLLHDSYIASVSGKSNIVYDNGDMYKYTLVDGGYKLSVTNLKKESTMLNVPSEVNGMKVVEIGEKVLKGDKCNVYKLVIPSSVKKVDGHFNYMDYYSSQNAKNKITELYIEDVNAFAQTTFIRSKKDALTYWSPLLTYAKLYVNGVYTEDIVFEEGLKFVSEHSFTNCEYIRSVSFPESLTSISEGAFNNCKNLTSAKFALPDNWRTEDATGQYTVNFSDSPDGAAKRLQSEYSFVKIKE